MHRVLDLFCLARNKHIRAWQLLFAISRLYRINCNIRSLTVLSLLDIVDDHRDAVRVTGFQMSSDSYIGQSELWFRLGIFGLI